MMVIPKLLANYKIVLEWEENICKVVNLLLVNYKLHYCSFKMYYSIYLKLKDEDLYLAYCIVAK